MHLKPLAFNHIGRFPGVDSCSMSKFLWGVGFFGIGRAFRYLSLACCWQEILQWLDLNALNRVNGEVVQTREVWALNLLVWVLVAPGSSCWLTLSLVGAQTSFFLCAAMIWALQVKTHIPKLLNCEASHVPRIDVGDQFLLRNPSKT